MKVRLVILEYIKFKNQKQWDGAFTDEEFLDKFLNARPSVEVDDLWELFRSGYKKTITREEFDRIVNDFLASQPSNDTGAKEFLKKTDLVPSYMKDDVMWEVDFDKLCKVLESFALSSTPNKEAIPTEKIFIHFVNEIMTNTEYHELENVEIVEKYLKAFTLTAPTKHELAKWMHDQYEEIAKQFGWNTQKSTKVEFDALPNKNQSTMLELAHRLISNWLLSRLKTGTPKEREG